MISRICWNLSDFGFKKNDGKNIDWRRNGRNDVRNGRKNEQNDKLIINTIYMKPDFPMIKKIVRLVHVTIAAMTAYS